MINVTPFILSVWEVFARTLWVTMQHGAGTPGSGEPHGLGSIDQSATVVLIFTHVLRNWPE